MVFLARRHLLLIWLPFLLLGCVSEPTSTRQIASVSTASDTLWTIVHGKCVPNQQANNKPDPCEKVVLWPSEEQGYAVLKDLRGASHFLLIPTAQITGIEDAQLLTPQDPNYWQSAWDEISRVGNILHKTLRRDQLALAVNSVGARSQNQLHIHMDCVEVGVRDLLLDHEDNITTDWSDTVTFLGEKLRVRRIEQENLGNLDPFKILASSLPTNQSSMGTHALVLVGAIFKNGKNGFYLLDAAKPPLGFMGTGAWGDLLLDRRCRTQ